MARIEPRSNSLRSTLSLALNIVYRPTEELKPDPANPRRHPKKQIRQIARSIETFGFNVPILVTTTATSSPGTAGISPAFCSA